MTSLENVSGMRPKSHHHDGDRVRLLSLGDMRRHHHGAPVTEVVNILSVLRLDS